MICICPAPRVRGAEQFQLYYRAGPLSKPDWSSRGHTAIIEAMMKNNQILKIYGTDYKEMTKQLLAAAGLSDHIRRKAAATKTPDSPGRKPEHMRIGIKPNLVCPSPAEFGATTHPEVVSGIVEYLQEEGFFDLCILEGSWIGDRTEDAFLYCGYRQFPERFGVPLLDTKKEPAFRVSCGDGMELSVAEIVNRIDFLINVPVLKGHCQTKVTCALKNLKGLVPDAEKRRFHRLGLHRPVAFLQKAVPQDFIVTDHICGDLDFEEGGNPVVRNCVMASLDPVLTDSHACFLLGLTPDDVPYIRIAEQLGIGSADLSGAEILEVAPGSGLRAEDKEPPRERRLLDVSYPLEEADSCSACYNALVSALSRLREEGILARLDTPVGIGQGMKGKEGVLGIGNCTSKFRYSIPGCPPEEEAVYEGLRAYLEGRA